MDSTSEPPSPTSPFRMNSEEKKDESGANEGKLPMSFEVPDSSTDGGASSSVRPVSFGFPSSTAAAGGATSSVGSGSRSAGRVAVSVSPTSTTVKVVRPDEHRMGSKWFENVAFVPNAVFPNLGPFLKPNYAVIVENEDNQEHDDAKTGTNITYSFTLAIRVECENNNHSKSHKDKKEARMESTNEEAELSLATHRSDVCYTSFYFFRFFILPYFGEEEHTKSTLKSYQLVLKRDIHAGKKRTFRNLEHLLSEGISNYLPSHVDVLKLRFLPLESYRLFERFFRQNRVYTKGNYLDNWIHISESKPKGLLYGHKYLRYQNDPSDQMFGLLPLMYELSSQKLKHAPSNETSIYQTTTQLAYENLDYTDIDKQSLLGKINKAKHHNSSSLRIHEQLQKNNLIEFNKFLLFHSPCLIPLSNYRRTGILNKRANDAYAFFAVKKYLIKNRTSLFEVSNAKDQLVSSFSSLDVANSNSTKEVDFTEKTISDILACLRFHFDQVRPAFIQQLKTDNKRSEVYSVYVTFVDKSWNRASHVETLTLVHAWSTISQSTLSSNFSFDYEVYRILDLITGFTFYSETYFKMPSSAQLEHSSARKTVESIAKLIEQKHANTVGLSFAQLPPANYTPSSVVSSVGHILAGSSIATSMQTTRPGMVGLVSIEEFTKQMIQQHLAIQPDHLFMCPLETRWIVDMLQQSAVPYQCLLVPCAHPNRFSLFYLGTNHSGSSSIPIVLKTDKDSSSSSSSSSSISLSTPESTELDVVRTFRPKHIADPMVVYCRTFEVIPDPDRMNEVNFVFSSRKNYNTKYRFSSLMEQKKEEFTKERMRFYYHMLFAAFPSMILPHAYDNSAEKETPFQFKFESTRVADFLLNGFHGLIERKPIEFEGETEVWPFDVMLKSYLDASAMTMMMSEHRQQQRRRKGSSPEEKEEDHEQEEKEVSLETRSMSGTKTKYKWSTKQWKVVLQRLGLNAMFSPSSMKKYLQRKTVTF